MMPLPYYITPSLIWEIYKTSDTTSDYNLYTIKEDLILFLSLL